MSAEERQLRGLAPLPPKGLKPLAPVVALAHAPLAPKTLDPNGKKVWRKVIRHLLNQGLLVSGDLEGILGYCHAVQRAMAAEKFLQERGSQSYEVKGEERAYPQVAIAQTAWAEARRDQERLGLSPYDRSRLKVPTVPPVKATKEPEFPKEGSARFFDGR